MIEWKGDAVLVVNSITQSSSGEAHIEGSMELEKVATTPVLWPGRVFRCTLKRPNKLEGWTPVWVRQTETPLWRG